jgi:hypothetical protein
MSHGSLWEGGRMTLRPLQGGSIYIHILHTTYPHLGPFHADCHPSTTTPASACPLGERAGSFPLAGHSRAGVGGP